MQLSIAAIDINEVRKLYKEAPENEDKAEELWEMLSAEEKLSPILQAYKGATKAILAKHEWIVTKKYSYAKSGIEILHKAVKSDVENIEIRYLRFTIEHNLPSFLGLSKDEDEDTKAFVMHMNKRKNYSISESFFNEMAKFFIDSGKCSEEDIKKIKTEAGIK